MESDEIWAYRARSVDDITPVKVLRHGTKKPARVLVQFEDPSMEGNEEWVPPARLKVPWEDADAYRARRPGGQLFKHSRHRRILPRYT